ncbi:MAG: nucleotidyltransferase family protein [Pseudobdellovibrionaceae bacterium]
MNLIFLAAGLGKRMGCNKALMPFHGRPWILSQLEQVEMSGIEFQNILIVTNPDSVSLLEKLLSPVTPKPFLLLNPHPERGPFSSLRLAIAEAPEVDSCVCPIDVPLYAVSLKQLWEGWQRRTGDLEALIPSYLERKGHPVILSSKLKKSSLQISPKDPQARLDFILKSLPENKKKILAVKDPHIIKNLNTPEDLATLATNPT